MFKALRQSTGNTAIDAVLDVRGYLVEIIYDRAACGNWPLPITAGEWLAWLVDELDIQQSNDLDVSDLTECVETLKRLWVKPVVLPWNMFEWVENDLVFVGDEPTTVEEGLQISIEKWKQIVHRLESGLPIDWDGGTTTCGLCRIFHYNGERRRDSHKRISSCLSCPVALVTGQDECDGTPYENYSEERCKIESIDYAYLATLARAELAFLEGLVVTNHEMPKSRWEAVSEIGQETR